MLTYNDFLHVNGLLLQLTCEYARVAKEWSSTASFSQEEGSDCLAKVSQRVARLGENGRFITEGGGEVG